MFCFRQVETVRDSQVGRFVFDRICGAPEQQCTSEIESTNRLTYEVLHLQKEKRDLEREKAGLRSTITMLTEKLTKFGAQQQQQNSAHMQQSGGGGARGGAPM